MKTKIILSALLAMAVSANACWLPIRVACPNDTTASGIEVLVDNVPYLTDSLGMVLVRVWPVDTVTISVTKSTLPAGATLKDATQRVKVLNDAPPVVEFVLGGAFCSEAPPEGDCWLTGGGTIAKNRGVPNYSFGGVVYPGCSPKAADGGNWNVIDHAAGLHFQGKHIEVTECKDAPTTSPSVNVRTIYFNGTGTIGGIGGNDADRVEVDFEARATDNNESGGGSDWLYLKVVLKGTTTTVLKIGTSEAAPATISTGNLQIHTTSCSN